MKPSELDEWGGYAGWMPYSARDAEPHPTPGIVSNVAGGEREHSSRHGFADSSLCHTYLWEAR